MNRTLIFLFLCAVFCLSAMAHLSAQTDTRDYLIPNVGDTLYGKVEHIDRRGASPEYYKKIRVTNAKGKRKKYKRVDLESFRVDNVRYEGFWLSQFSNKIVLFNPKYSIDRENGERYFLRVMSTGHLSHYLMEWYEQGDSMRMKMDLLKKQEDEFFIRATQGVLGLKKKALIKYFQECPELSKKIEQKELKQVVEVIDFYNSHCAD
ncbi:MAG: hypothetical protein ACI9CP_001959 [Cryomorphaceae bacterium]|jgi:hypothetical protein